MFRDAQDPLVGRGGPAALPQAAAAVLRAEPRGEGPRHQGPIV